MGAPTWKAKTPFGEFTRTNPSNFSHVVVWECDRAMRAFIRAQSDAEYMRRVTGGIVGSWINHRGYAVSWHRWLDRAERNAAQGYSWDHTAKPLGIFEVTR